MSTTITLSRSAGDPVARRVIHQVLFGIALTAAAMLIAGSARAREYPFWSSRPWTETAADGRLKALMLTSAEPFAALPNIPSARQAGVNNIDMVSWWSVHVPTGTPKPVVDKLTGWFNEIARSDDVKKFLANLGSDPLIGDAALVDQMIAKEIKEWENYVKIAKIEPQ